MARGDARQAAVTPLSSEERPTFVERFNKHPIIASVLALAAVVGAVGALWSPVRSAHDKLTWRSAEESKIESMRTGITLDAIRDTFGTPLASAPIKGGKRYIWKGRGYWVVAGVHEDVASSYLVQVCDPKLRPTLGTTDTTITANKTTFAQVHKWPVDQIFYNYAASRIDSFEGIRGSHASGFTHVFWGVGEACDSAWLGGGTAPIFVCVRPSPKRDPGCIEGAFTPMNPETSETFQHFRRHKVVNLFGETSASSGLPPSDELYVTWEEYARLD